MLNADRLTLVDLREFRVFSLAFRGGDWEEIHGLAARTLQA